MMAINSIIPMFCNALFVLQLTKQNLGTIRDISSIFISYIRQHQHSSQPVSSWYVSATREIKLYLLYSLLLSYALYI